MISSGVGARPRVNTRTTGNTTRVLRVTNRPQRATTVPPGPPRSHPPD